MGTLLRRRDGDAFPTVRSYLDFYVDEYGGTEDLPYLNSYEFTKLLFERCPLLQHYSDRFSGFITKFKVRRRLV